MKAEQKEEEAKFLNIILYLTLKFQIIGLALEGVVRCSTYFLFKINCFAPVYFCNLLRFYLRLLSHKRNICLFSEYYIFK